LSLSKSFTWYLFSKFLDELIKIVVDNASNDPWLLFLQFCP
jgi:hypothetical protein